MALRSHPSSVIFGFSVSSFVRINDGRGWLVRIATSKPRGQSFELEGLNFSKKGSSDELSLDKSWINQANHTSLLSVIPRLMLPGLRSMSFNEDLSNGVTTKTRAFE